MFGGVCDDTGHGFLKKNWPHVTPCLIREERFYVWLYSLRQYTLCQIGRLTVLTGGLTNGACRRNKEKAFANQAMKERGAKLTILSYM